MRRRLRLDSTHFDRLTVQRTFKIVGTFFAFAARGSTRHLALVPLALETAKRALERLPEAAPLRALELDRSLDAVADAASRTA